MGLRDELTADIAEAFDTDLADAVTAFTGTQQGDEGYDPVTGEMTTSATTYAGRGVFGSYSNDEIDGSSILATDERLTVLQAEVLVTEAGITTDARAAPKVGDMISGRRVIQLGKDPAGATWIIQLRA
ncbi:hypothetical protein [Pseudomonas phage PS-1]|uniref:hypothetical protein n=1 Tax=Pseudomonas phage PS-1 TaxID=1573458 RepID=UPI00065C2298|nr:hypothetical protein AXI79_gp60 [Pseudomonas phage PS-1]BAR92398.1 hypothetical protein [Pseudomonas phage PS-1]